MMDSGMNLIPRVVAFVISATFIVFVCTIIICERIRRSRFQNQSGVDLEQPEEQIRGLEPVVVAAMPTLKFNSEGFNSFEETQCSICLGEYQEKHVLRIMPKRGHNFHLSCIDLWLRKQSTCPVCRLPLPDISEAKQMTPATQSIPNT
ncbi:Arabidopsis Toxicos en Levadura 68 [Hibiscus trionum]|uniref:Arabidopsis Toxicos en Levadura 68 n=1 Tax=Hibiscus trionum TaxID=183268 RepID=A0A9W7H212_HIBTR|nr:Arabidopsis Toxicos en Levadura 68 [Hibiscus trionum]